MPPVFTAALGAAVSTGVAVATGATLIGGYWLTHFLVTTALGALLNVLTAGDEPNIPVADNSLGYDINAISTIAPHAIIYGKRRVGGVRIYDETTNNETVLHRIIALAGHEVDEIVEIYANDELLTLDGSGNVTAPEQFVGQLRIIKHLGSPTQLADPTLAAASAGLWTSNHKLSGIAYLYIQMQGDREAFPTGAPTFTALVKGKKVYDPRTGLTVWSDNSALCVADYLMEGYGLNVAKAKIDWAYFTTAANISDESVALAAGGTEKRYTMNGTFLTSMTRGQALQNMLTSCAGSIFYGQGLWKIFAGAYITPVETFTKGDFRSNVRISPTHSINDNFNSVGGTFISAETDWQPSDFPSIESATFLDEDNGVPAMADLNLPFTSTSTMAQRIAKILLYRNREQITMSVRLSMRGFAIQVGDVIMIDDEAKGWSSKTFEVVKWGFGYEDLTPYTEVTLREISAEVFDWDADETVFTSNNTNLPSAFSSPTVGVSAQASTRVTPEKISSIIAITVTSTLPDQIDSVEIQYKLSSEIEYTNAGSGVLGTYEIVDLEDASYDVRARGISAFGQRGGWAVVAGISPSSLGTSPSDILNFTAQLNGTTVSLAWDATADLTLSYYRIRHSSEETAATWANAVTLIDKVARPATSIAVPALPGTYHIRAYDKQGTPSENYTSIIVPETYLEDYTTTTTQVDDPTFSGSKTDCSVTANELRIDDPSEAWGLLTYSEAFTLGDWVSLNVTITSDDINDPLGNLTADKCVGSGTGTSPHYIQEASVTVVQDEWYNFSVYVKPDELFQARLMAFHGAAVFDSAGFDLTSDEGSVLFAESEGVDSALITDEGDGWFRMSIDVKNTVDTTTELRIYMMSSEFWQYDASIITGGLHFWGAQMTLGKGRKTYRQAGANTLNNVATYELNTYIDTTAVRRVRARMDIEVNRFDASSGLFDDLVGNIDSLPGLWDGLTSTPQFSDINIKSYIATTDDDPSGSPVWSDFRQFHVGDYYGRAFKFKVELSTESHNVTPSISGLTARIQY